MSKLSKNILGQIKKENVKPKSRWYFIALHTTIWVAAIITIVLGSMGIAVAMRHLRLTDWELANEISSNPLSFMPLLWFGIIAAAIFVADWVFKKTKKGYKFKVSHVIIASILLAVTLGGGFFLAEADQGFESAIRENFKPYRTWEDKQAARFVVPHLGILAGKITEISEEWIVVDFKGNQWRVDISDAQLEQNFEPIIGDKIGMKGERLSKEIFKAYHIREFEDPREQLRKRREQFETHSEAIRVELYEVLTAEQRMEIREDIGEKELREFHSLREKMEYQRSNQ